MQSLNDKYDVQYNPIREMFANTGKMSANISN